jgi:hypothetical protein
VKLIGNRDYPAYLCTRIFVFLVHSFTKIGLVSIILMCVFEAEGRQTNREMCRPLVKFRRCLLIIFEKSRKRQEPG